MNDTSGRALFLTLVAGVRKISLLYKLQWKLRSYFYTLKFRVLVGRPVVNAGPILERAIEQKIPMAAGKMGSTEAAGLNIRLRRLKQARKSGRPRSGYSQWITHTLFVNSGVFPQNEQVFDRFGDDYLLAVQECDVLASWNVAGEAEIFRDYCPHTTFVRLASLDPCFCEVPWSRALQGKRVLVISPFAKSIEQQYAKRTAIWRDQHVLPEFELLTIRAPFSAGLVPSESADWFDALAQLEQAMNTLDYDVALIGAGAFSLPLAVNARRHRKVGIHLGGSLQILFGIVGSRWEKRADFKGIINESWRRPSAEETPPSFRRNEEGAYW